MPRETHAPGPKTHVTPLQRYISTLLTCKVTLVLCHAYKLGLTEGQEVVGAKRGGKCIGIYIDDERQSSRPPGPRPAGLAANAPSAASPRFKGSTDPVFTAASCIWSVCRQSTLICRRDRALELPRF